THLTTPEKTPGSRTLGAVHFKVLALPNRITSRICAPLFGARARLTLLHWSAAMRLPLALLVLLSLRSPPHSIGAANPRVGSSTRHCFRNGAPDGLFPADYNDLSSKIE